MWSGGGARGGFNEGLTMRCDRWIRNMSMTPQWCEWAMIGILCRLRRFMMGMLARLNRALTVLLITSVGTQLEFETPPSARWLTLFLLEDACYYLLIPTRKDRVDKIGIPTMPYRKQGRTTHVQFIYYPIWKNILLFCCQNTFMETF